MRVIKPGKFVFHASYSAMRNSILEKGLLKGDNFITKNRVYAHNAYRPNFSWYPFTFDELFSWNNLGSMNLMDSDGVFKVAMDQYGLNIEGRDSGYDFWRIDTYKLKRKWFVDEIAESEFRFDEETTVPLYIYTEGDIPADCLTLYRFHENISVYKGDGVAHVVDDFRKFKF